MCCTTKIYGSFFSNAPMGWSYEGDIKVSIIQYPRELREVLGVRYSLGRSILFYNMMLEPLKISNVDPIMIYKYFQCHCMPNRIQF